MNRKQIATAAAGLVATSTIAFALPASAQSSAPPNPSPSATSSMPQGMPSSGPVIPGLSGAPQSSTSPSVSSAGRSRHEVEIRLTGAKARKATAAAKKAVPGGKVVRVETDRDHGSAYEAHVHMPDGTRVIVLMTRQFTVIRVEHVPATASSTASGANGSGPSSSGTSGSGTSGSGTSGSGTSGSGTSGSGTSGSGTGSSASPSSSTG